MTVTPQSSVTPHSGVTNTQSTVYAAPQQQGPVTIGATTGANSSTAVDMSARRASAPVVAVLNPQQSGSGLGSYNAMSQSHQRASSLATQGGGHASGIGSGSSSSTRAQSSAMQASQGGGVQAAVNRMQQSQQQVSNTEFFL